ncbi:MAG: FecR family protein [Spirochaetaceae bacterium]|jgi:hypothetical protein|nr:FecR family protein [Spirochaetaceae bacterium]
MRFDNKIDRARLLNTVAAAVCILGMAAGVYLFYHNAKKTTARSAGAVGIVFAKQHNVQRRPAGRDVWHYTGRGAALFSGDTVRTGKFSSVTIELNNGDSFTMRENTSAAVFYNVSLGGSVKLQNGEVLASVRSGKFCLAANGRRVYPEAGSRAVVRALAGSGDVEAYSAEGTLMLDSGENIYILNEGESNTIGAAGALPSLWQPKEDRLAR